MIRQIKTTAACIAASMAIGTASLATALGFVGSADVKLSLPANMDISADVEYRTADRLKHTDRWGLGAGLGYKVNKHLKIHAGYNFYQEFNPASTDRKGRDVNSFWASKHRAYAGLTGSIKVWKFELSLRERYQYTYRTELEVPRFDEGEPDGNKTVDAKSKHVLRSRLQVSFKPYKKCRFEPYASYELYSLLHTQNHTEHAGTGGKAVDKWRITAGCSYKINRHNSVELFYRYVHATDPDEYDAANQIGVSYSLKF